MDHGFHLMARTHARILSTIVTDPDFCALDPAAKWAYVQLLAQPKLTLVGSLDFMPDRWAKAFDGGPREGIERAVSDLEQSLFVVVDREAGELLIRTFVRHDFATLGRNRNLVKGVWAAWERTESERLRKVSVDNMPESIWEVDGVKVPSEAEHMRRSERLELRSEPRFEPRSELSYSLLPATYSPQPASFNTSHAEPGSEPRFEPRSATETEAEAFRLAHLLADLIAADGSTRPNVSAAWVKDMDRLMRIDNRTADQVERAIRWVHETPGNFWASNILSPSKLRKQYTALQKAHTRETSGHNGNGARSTKDQRTMSVLQDLYNEGETE